MLDGLRTVWQAIQRFRLQGYTYIWANLGFIVLCLPIVSAPAAFSALMRIGHAAEREPSEADIDLFWQTTKQHLWSTLPWGAAHLIFALFNFGNLWMYSEEPGIVAALLRLTWIGLGWIWFGIVLYTWPIYYEMEQPGLWGATRNAFVMVLQNPFFTGVILFSLLLTAVVSTILVVAWVLLTWGFFAALANRAVLNRLEIYRQRQETL